MTRVNAARSLFVTIGIFSLLHCASNEPRLPEESVVEDGHFDFRGLFDQEADVVCEGFKTPVEGDGYCSEDVPDSWQSFEYDGEVYYFSPLASND